MSGGAYDYAFGKVTEVAEQIVEKGDCSAAPPHLRKAFKAHLRKIADALKAIEWNDSGDGDQDEEDLLREILGPGRCFDGSIDQLLEVVDTWKVITEELLRNLKP
jgi:hypothetical protein